MNEILIFVELTRDFKIAPVVFELSSEAQKLKNKLVDSTISAVLIGDDVDYSDILKELSSKGFDKCYLIKDKKYKNYSTIFYSNIFSKLIDEISPKILLFGATRLGRDLAPRISARLNLGLTADCTELDIDENNNLIATRPTFGGNLMATIVSNTFPQMATVRPNVFRSVECIESKNFEVIEKKYDDSNLNDFVEFIKYLPFDNEENNNLSDAKIIVSGGLGMKNKEGFRLIQELADVLNASVGASRKAVEKGLAEQHIQVGQTGKTVMPKLYIACGISGAVQHIVGMNMSDKIIAINSDKNAPIFNYADYGIVGDVFEILPKLIKILKG